MSIREKIQKSAKLIRNSKYLVAFTGAGISTDSGLSDYRGPDGVWTRRDKGLAPKPGPTISEVLPNEGHVILAELLKQNKLKYLISQNVDGLHIASGVAEEFIAELHGNYSKMKCISCDSRFTKTELNWIDSLYGKGFRTSKIHKDQPSCPNCFGRIISSVVNFGDPMPEKEMELAINHSKMADVYLVIGSSLVVQPAASLPMYCLNNRGDIIIINIGKTPLDSIASVKIEDKISLTLAKIYSLL